MFAYNRNERTDSSKDIREIVRYSLIITINFLFPLKIRVNFFIDILFRHTHTLLSNRD